MKKIFYINKELIKYLLVSLVLLLGMIFYFNHSPYIEGKADVFTQNEKINTLDGMTSNQSQILLSQMSESDCLDFIISNGVEIPDEFYRISELGYYVKKIIETVEENPNYNFNFINCQETFNLAESIKNVVNQYYNVTDTVQTYEQKASTSYYILQDSWVMDADGNWVSSGGY